ncbi:hypothetical protein GGR54DRAFT_642413 [Hypoxylon sp. NC1633]|nr:hypothetical protein GGR54DRAFT_642413 [Hypoxylon sp. NC1633]
MNVLEIMYAPLMFCAKYVVLRQIQTIFLQHQHQSFAHKGTWVPTLEGRCINTQPALISSSAINMVSDITILILPVVTIWQLQMPMKSKLEAAPVFAVGVVAIVASIVRFYYTVKLAQSEDVTHSIEPFAYWT